MAAPAAACPANTHPVGGHLCAMCPPIDPQGSQHAQQQALLASPYRPGGPRANSTIYQSQIDPSHRNKRYCGSEPYIVDATLYAQCHPQSGFVNPYGYRELGTPLECFNQGKNLGANNNNAGRGGGGGGGGGAAPPPAGPAPLVGPLPVVVPLPPARRGPGRPARQPPAPAVPQPAPLPAPRHRYNLRSSARRQGAARN